jgi:hypothetical protein
MTFFVFYFPPLYEHFLFSLFVLFICLLTVFAFQCDEPFVFRCNFLFSCLWFEGSLTFVFCRLIFFSLCM